MFEKKAPKQARVNGMPGTAHKEAQLDPAVTMAVLNGNGPRIGEEDIAKATEILQKYKDGKANLETRVIENEQWYKLQHWDVLRRKSNENSEKPMPNPTSGWLFNSLNNKHADAMDNFPEPMVLPREPSDEQNAKLLSQILPVVMEYNQFERTYDQAWWSKLKNGAAVYGVFWNNELNNGLGDVEVREIDLLKIFWEPGITYIQDSANLFITDLVDEDVLNAEYPQYAGKMGGGVIDLSKYVYDDVVDTEHKSLVVDWYYKRTLPGGKKIVHYVKFVGKQLLYASENDPEYQMTGWYEDGKYPVVVDRLFPEAGTPVGFGYLDLCKDPQMYIDKLWANILKHSDMATRLKFFSNVNNDISEAELLDPDKTLVHCSGDVSDERLKQIVTKPLDGIYATILQMKVDEMKDTSSNRDVNSGSTGSGVTAAAAIAALQEAGNKSSRDMIKGSYRAYAEICDMDVDRMRQFYTEERTFRITNGTGYGFVNFNGMAIREVQMPPAYEGQDLEPGYEPVFRVPVFDIKIHAQRKNPFSRMEQNERAKELYGSGFFAPENAQAALIALEMMDFEGREKIIEKVQQGQTLMNIVQQMSARMDQMAMIIQSLSGMDMGMGAQNGADGQKNAGASAGQNAGKTGAGELASGIMESQQQQTPYMQRMVHRSTPKME